MDFSPSLKGGCHLSLGLSSPSGSIEDRDRVFGCHSFRQSAILENRLHLSKGKGFVVAVLLAVTGAIFAAGPPKNESGRESKKTFSKPLPVELEEHRRPSLVTKGDCFIKGGTLLTITNGTIENGNLLVRDGKIAAIGKGLTPPEGVTVIDATGKFVMPGIVDAHSHIASDATNEFTDSITAEVRIEDVLDPESLSLFQKLASGITTSLVLHGSANAIGGQSAVIKHKRNRPASEMLVPGAPRIIKFALGENVKQSNWPANPTRFPSTRMGVEAVYRRAFIDARRYMAEWDRYEQTKGSNPSAVPPRRDLRLETLADILRGEILVHCHSYRADEMLMMLRLAKEFGFRLGALQHALEAYKIAPEIAASGVGVSTFADFWSYKMEAWDAIPYNAALCVRAGILTSINSDSGSGLSPLNLDAAQSMKYGGLSEDEALRLITLVPAKQLGIERRVGSLEIGKDADLAIWDGHPFRIASKPVMTLVEGEVHFQRRDAFDVDWQTDAPRELNVCRADHLALPTPKTARSYAIVGGTVHPVSGPPIPNGTVTIRDGRIVAVGRKVRVSGGAVVVNAKGLHVYPGFIDAGSLLGLTEIGSVRSTVDAGEGGEFQPDLLTLTAVHPDSEHFAVTRNNGITATLAAPSGGRIRGRSAVIRLSGWTPDQMKVRAPLALHVGFPDGASGLYRSENAPSEEQIKRRREEETKQIRSLREYVERAKRYAEARRERPDGTPEDPRLEAMIPYVKRQAPVMFHVRYARGIRNALKFAEELDLLPIIAGGQEAWKVAELLAEKKVPVLLTPPSVSSPGGAEPFNDYDPYDAPLAAPGILQRAGVRFAFGSEDAAMAKNLPQQAGASCGYGLSRDAAIRALTLDAAEILGLSHELGSLTPGKAASLFIADGDPLEVTTSLHALFIDGKPIPLESKHTRLYARYRQRLQPAQRAAKK